MEMSMAQEPLRRPVRGPHGGWNTSEIDALQRRIDEAAQSGQSLRSVFDQLAQELGRKPNSIRNFYYARLRAQSGEEMGRALPFETFSQDEVEQLLRSVLTARAQGMSVRACVRRLADGDRARMLRYQNKYRSTIRTRPELVRKVMENLAQEGIPFVSPYAAEEADMQDALPRLKAQAASAGDAQLTQLFSSLDHLLALALAPKAEEKAQSAPPLAQDSDAQRRADRLAARCDMLRIALDDEQMKRGQMKSAAEDMVTLIKEYIALPQGERAQQTELFCQQAVTRLSAVECALMLE